MTSTRTGVEDGWTITGHYCPFSPHEDRHRIHSVQAAARCAGIDVPAVTDPANICYLTGYDGARYYVTQAAVLSSADDHPVLVLRAQDVAGARWMTRLRAQDVVGYDETYVFDGNNAMSLVGEVIRERGWADGTVGAEFDAHSLRPSGLTALRSSLPGTRVVDGTGTVNWVRSIKTSAELDTMRAAGRISDHAMIVAMQHCSAHAPPGVAGCPAELRFLIRAHRLVGNQP